MERVVIFLHKYSDWLEAYCVIAENPLLPIVRHFVENDLASMKSIFDFLAIEKISCFPHRSFSELDQAQSELKDGNIFVAPFCRRRSLWRLAKRMNKDNETVCLSESLPESFGLFGYRLGFRGKTNKTRFALPLLALNDLLNKPDVGYFPYTEIKNPFVKKSLKAAIPVLSPSRQKVIEGLTQGEKRPLVVRGWGYNLDNMVSHLGLEEYIATSKGLELVVDGKRLPISERICSEEVLLSGLESYIVGYNSATMVWARYLYPDMEIYSYETNVLKEKFGEFGKYSLRNFKKPRIEMKDQCKEMLD